MRVSGVPQQVQMLKKETYLEFKNYHKQISITDKAKINEQNKSIAVGPLYIGTYFEQNWTLLPEDVAVLNPTGYRTL